MASSAITVQTRRLQHVARDELYSGKAVKGDLINVVVLSATIAIQTHRARNASIEVCTDNAVNSICIVCLDPDSSAEWQQK